MAGRIMGNKKYENFTLSLAFFDALPVLFFCTGAIILACALKSALFIAGAVLCTLAGGGKVLWKIILAANGKSIDALNKQMRILMPCGFALIIAGIAANIKAIDFKAVLSNMASLPAVIFFAIGVIGIIMMGIFAAKLDQTKSKSNWIEQITNATAQGAILLGIIFAILN